MNGTMMRLWAGLFVLVVFVGGLAAGFVVRPMLSSAFSYRSPRPAFEPGPRFARGPRGARRPRVTERLLDRIATQIALTPDQRQQLEAVFENRRQRFRRLDEDIRRQFETEQEQMTMDIATILTAEQMEVFENEIIQMRRDRRRPERFRSPPQRPEESRRPPPWFR